MNAASWAVVIDNADWGAAAVLLAVVLALAGAAWSGWQAPDALYNRYRDNRARTKAAIDVDRILPELAKLIAAVNDRLATVLAQDLKEPVTALPLEGATAVNTLRDQLQAAGYREHLERVSTWSADYEATDTLYDSAVSWARARGGAASVALLLTIFVAAHVVPKSHPIEPSIIGVGEVLGGVAIVLIAVFYVLELIARNRLGRLFRRYE